jgi:ABC-2 type transport system permease protein
MEHATAAESAAFWRLRRRLMANLAREALSTARLRTAFVILLTTVFWIALYVLFVEGFRFLDLSIPHAQTRAQVASKIFELFFFSILVMLLFSTGILLYGSLYRAREARFLLTTPARDARVFLHKFQEAMVFGSWGSVLLGSPLLVAYGRSIAAPWPYYVMLLPALVAFVFIPGALGAVGCLGVVHFMPRSRNALLAAGGAIMVVGIAWIVASVTGGSRHDLLTTGWFHEALGRVSFSDGRLLPSWWLSAGLLDAAAGHWSQGVMFLSLLVSNALVCHQFATWAASRWYRAGLSELHDRRTARAAGPLAAIDRWLSRAAWPLSPHLRQLIAKDVRVFRRDPVQWSQFLIFFGLLGMYFLNIRRLSYDLDSAAWVNMISFLNLGVVGLILSTFTTRFIFPMISLEGRRFWILGLLPLRRGTLLWGKFLFAAGGSLATCLGLIALNDLLLGVGRLIAAMHGLTCVVLCLGLSGIAVGLGAAMPNLREDSPAKIAAGFGGTLNLVLSTIYILTVVGLTAVPCHLQATGMALGPNPLPLDPGAIRAWLWAGAAGSIALGIAATAIPLALGFRAFQALEF